MVEAAGGRIWSPYYQEVSSGQVKEAHESGLEVKVWTVNDVEQMEALIKMGVDGIITDYPDRLRKVLQRLGMPMPAQTPVLP